MRGRKIRISAVRRTNGAGFCAQTVEQNNPFTVPDHKAVISRFRRRATHFFDCHAPFMVAVDCDGPKDKYPGGEELLDIGGETRVAYLRRSAT